MDMLHGVCTPHHTQSTQLIISHSSVIIHVAYLKVHDLHSVDKSPETITIVTYTRTIHVCVQYTKVMVDVLTLIV